MRGKLTEQDLTNYALNELPPDERLYAESILGVSEATASRLCAGHYELSPERAKEWELALLVVRLFRSLDALWGHDAAAHTWLASDNLALAARPVDLIPSVEGLVRVVNYLDNARGRL